MRTRAENRQILGIFAVTAAALLAGCGPPPVDPLEKGRSELARMSDVLAGAASFTFSTVEEHVRPGRGPEPVTREVSRQIAIRRSIEGLGRSPRSRSPGDRDGELRHRLAVKKRPQRAGTGTLS